MKQLKILVFCTLTIGMHAQSLDNWVIGTGGASNVNSGGQLSWTLGETCTSAISTYKGWITEGFHQPYLEIEAIESSDRGNIEINVYPNPATNHILINLTDGKARDFNQILTDAQGRMISYSQWEQVSESLLNISEFSSGIYFLQIQFVESDVPVNQSFKIIKH